MWEDIAINDKWKALNGEIVELESKLQKLQAKKDRLAKKSVDLILDNLRAKYAGKFFKFSGMVIGANMRGKAITFITEVSVDCGPLDKFPKFNINYETLILRDYDYYFGNYNARYLGNDKISFLEELGDEISKEEALETIAELRNNSDVRIDKIIKRINELKQP